jgi:2'-5' RNA ligase
MPRLFVAIHPPREIRERLIGLMGGVAGARWQSEDQLHLTLRFIGEADRHLTCDIDAALGAIHHPGFALSLHGLGAFERRGRPEILWAGVAPAEPVKTLHNKIDQALALVGVEPDRRAFAPHITLARLKPSAGPIHHLLGEAGGLTGAPFPVDSFSLYESELTPSGAVHSILERYWLD